MKTIDQVENYGRELAREAWSQKTVRRGRVIIEGAPQQGDWDALDRFCGGRATTEQEHAFEAAFEMRISDLLWSHSVRRNQYE